MLSVTYCYQVHRDLKAENILLSSGVAKVGDFGLSKALVANPTMTKLAGTPKWLVLFYLYSSVLSNSLTREAPEVLIGAKKHAKHSKRADAYSFAMLLAEMLIGEDPFPDIELLEQLQVRILSL
mmetsp:Transcript_2204/g.2455  ORF Transcript_2204/g.2455 Transcript_2204/m.2455 type:complete len:124 (-) Transcript_2204:376-747(-)